MTPPTGKPLTRTGRSILDPKLISQEVKLVAKLETLGQFQPIKLGSNFQKATEKNPGGLRVGVGTPSPFMEQVRQRFGTVPKVKLSTRITSRSLSLPNQARPGVVTIDWSNFPTIMAAESSLHHMIGSVAESTSLGFAEIRIYLHQDPAGRPNNLPQGWVRVQMDKGQQHERSYQLNIETNILVVDLYGVTTEMLELYADGFIASELLEAYMELGAQRVGPRQRIHLQPVLSHLQLWHDLYWVDRGNAIPLKRGISEQTLRQEPRSKIHFQPQTTVPSIPGARFKVVVYRNFSYDFSHLESQLRGVSVTLPADDPTLIRDELTQTRRSYFNDFAFYTAATLRKHYSHRLNELVGGYDSYDLEIRLSRDDTGKFVVEKSDGGHAKIVLKLTLANERLSRVLTMNHRIYSLIDRLFSWDMSVREPLSQ